LETLDGLVPGLLRPCVIEAMVEGVDAELEGFEAGREVFDAVRTRIASPRTPDRNGAGASA
jgi:hypothetical protein